MSNRSAGTRILVNVILGPPIGTSLASTWGLSQGLFDFSSLAPREISAGIGMAFGIGYLLGSLPALLNGLITTWLFPLVSTFWLKLIIALGSGAVAPLPITFLLSSGTAPSSLLWMTSILGGLTSMVIAVLLAGAEAK